MTGEVKDYIQTKEVTTEDITITNALKAAGLVESNGSANVTISNVAPTAVGTATISSWLKVDISGTDFFIPMWT